MFIKSIQPLNYGPFAKPTTLHLEPDVTVLTGPNDTGKTSLLCLIRHVLTSTGQQSLTAAEFNLDNLHAVQADWGSRDDFGAMVEVVLAKDDPLPPHAPDFGKRQTGYRARVNIAPGKRTQAIEEWRLENKGSHKSVMHFPDIFQVVSLPPNVAIRDTITFADTSPLELLLLRVALGRAFLPEQLTQLPDSLFEAQLGRAESNLNDRLKGLLPLDLGIQWKMRATSDRKGLHCYLLDRHGAYTPLGSRGSGVRKVMAVLATLMSNDWSSGWWVVTFDEPETSLHADAQHLLRRVLEELAERPNVQVVYATHSPSMVNVMRPHALRLLSRDRQDDKPTSVIDNKPFRENFLPVRASLGLTPADSLLYAPVTVVVEGDTEVVALPHLLLKLADAGVAGFERVRHLLNEVHFLDGVGDQFALMCKLARSQGAKPVVFLDGDKRRHLTKFAIPDDIPVVLLDGEQEFEELVPQDVYLRAAMDVIDDEVGQVTIDGYENWVAGAGLNPRLAFTKRVRRWLEEAGIPEPNKARAMRRAVELVEVGAVQARPLLDLLRAIERLVS